MGEFYYSADPVSAHDLRRIRVSVYDIELMFDTDAGVFSKDGLDKGTRSLLEAMPPLRGRIFDLGCGWGPVGAFLKARQPELEVIMTDINRRAAELSKRNLALNHLEGKVCCGDGFENVEGCFDAIITNPPIRTGKQVIYGLFSEAYERLSEGGSLFLVIRKQQGAGSAITFLKQKFDNVEIMDRSGGFWTIRADR